MRSQEVRTTDTKIAALLENAARAFGIGETLTCAHFDDVIAGGRTSGAAELARISLPGCAGYSLSLHGLELRTVGRVERYALSAIAAELARLLTRSSAEEGQATREYDEGRQVSGALDFVNEAFLLVRIDWTIAHVNKAFELMFNRLRGDLIGKSHWAEFPETVGTNVEREYRLAMTSRSVRIFEDNSLPSRRWYQFRAFPCDDGLTVLIFDITGRRGEELAKTELEQKVLQAQKLESLGTLAAGIAHDFNNIVSAILGHVSLLRERVSPGSPLRESVEQIGIAGLRARDLIQKILAFGKANKPEFVRQSLQPLVTEALALLRATLPAGAQLTETLTDEPLCATVDPGEVQQMVMNLCTNAWQALEDGQGKIRVALRCVEVDEPKPATIGKLLPGRYAEITVSDTGVGISFELLQRLFEPFFTTKPRGKGTGLGLHVLRNIVETHGGAVAVTSEPGHGSSFSVYLSAAVDTVESPAAAPAKAANVGRGERVAYVDDDPVVLLMVERLLQSFGFEVTTYSNPEDFVTEIARMPCRFDALVTDYSMPEMTGVALARQVNKSCPSIPVIVSSGYVSDELRIEAADAGIKEILNKENAFEALGPAVRRVLDHRKSGNESLSLPAESGKPEQGG